MRLVSEPRKMSKICCYRPFSVCKTLANRTGLQVLILFEFFLADKGNNNHFVKTYSLQQLPQPTGLSPLSRVEDTSKYTISLCRSLDSWAVSCLHHHDLFYSKSLHLSGSFSTGVIEYMNRVLLNVCVASVPTVERT